MKRSLVMFALFGFLVAIPASHWAFGGGDGTMEAVKKKKKIRLCHVQGNEVRRKKGGGVIVVPKRVGTVITVSRAAADAHLKSGNHRDCTRYRLVSKGGKDCICSKIIKLPPKK